MTPRKLILRSFLAPGDILMLTAAVRDLHACYPGQFLTDVRTSCPELWENNPFLTPLDESSPATELIDCHYPLIQHSNQASYHFVHGYSHFLNQKLGLNIIPTAFRGDIHLSPAELSAPSPVQQRTSAPLPYWLVVAGGKYDYTIKWWDFRRYQQVIDHFRERICFAQVGEQTHFHPPLHGVLDFRGKTSLRQMIQLMHHSQGVLCPVTFFMHLAAAVPAGQGSKSRPCVVVAGGREPPQWEAYPHHQYIHTIGALPCCALGGCWRSRALPLGDGDDKDKPENLCVAVFDGLPKCMDLITAEGVSRRIELYFQSGMIHYLTAPQFQTLPPHLSLSLRNRFQLA